MLTVEQIKAGRALVGMTQVALARAAGVAAPTIKRIEAGSGPVAANYSTVEGIRAALEAAGVVFIPENGGGAGVRLRK